MCARMVCTDMFIDMSMDMCRHMCTDMSIDMRTDMCTDMCLTIDLRDLVLMITFATLTKHHSHIQPHRPWFRRPCKPTTPTTHHRDIHRL